MDKQFSTYAVDYRSDSIVCSTCGMRGKVVWDDIYPLSNSEPDLLEIDGPFFERISRKPPYPIELVCRECGGMAVTANPSTFLHDRQEHN